MHRWQALVAIVVLAIGVPGAARADGASEAEALVRSLYYEGLPADRARALDDAGVARLGELLRDAGEVEHHGNIVEALGHSGHPSAFAILRAFADAPPSGELDRAAFRARSILPQAIGQLARSDPRALAWLLAAAARTPRDPGWSFRQHHGSQLRALLDEQVLTGLALSGAPAARTAIDAALAERGDGPLAERRRRHARFAKELRERVARGDPAAGNGR